jgi:hypothetical protein
MASPGRSSLSTWNAAELAGKIQYELAAKIRYEEGQATAGVE